MAPSKVTARIEKPPLPEPYKWCNDKENEYEITLLDLQHSYRLNYPACPNYCRRTCKRNPRCLWGFGEKKWIRNNEESHSDEEDEHLNRNEGQLAGIVNLGATCYVNSLLQLWFHNPILRPAILKWRPNNIEMSNDSTVNGHDESYKPGCPISHLQAMFARMLLSKRSAIDPAQFTSSLELNTGEQQDAQEFSNLLMTLLDGLLEKYQSREIKNLIKDSFTGTSAFETSCDSCKHTSVSECDFRELGLGVKANLKDSITDYLKVELLNNTNQYKCGKCGLTTDAKRRITIRRLPPVLNLQLMRFVYDRESQSKKKVKTQIAFPETLNMTEFVENSNANDESNTYILNAVLYHKGKTAHHGHYIAQIRDMSNGSWFECNDDSVQPIKSSSKTLVIKNDEANNNSTTGDGKAATNAEYTSDGAYMLVYTRKSYMHNPNKNLEVHDYLKKLVMEEDKVYEEEYMKNKLSRDAEIRRKDQRQEEINLLYRDALQSSSSINKIEPQNAKKGNNEATQNENTPMVTSTNNSRPQPSHETPNNPGVPSEPDEFDFIPNSFLPKFFDLNIDPKIENAELICSHGKLKPPCLNDTGVAYRIIPSHFSNIVFSKYEFDTRLRGNSALCYDCVKTNFKTLTALATLEKDYKMFTDLNKASEEETVWISSELLRKWKRHAKLDIEEKDTEIIYAGNGNDEEDDIVNSELKCDHGNLNPSVSKNKINFTAWTVICKYFPKATYWPADTEPCAECLNISQSNSIVQQQNKVVAGSQKNYLMDLYFDRNRPNINESNGNFYIVPTSFINEWKKFIRDPTKTSYPMLNIDQLFCPAHGIFMYPINMMTELVNAGVLDESLITILFEDEWNYLKDHIAPERELKITISNRAVEYVCEVCEFCSTDWWTTASEKVYTYENGNIYIEKRGELEDNSKENSHGVDEDVVHSSGKREKREPIRRSKRTRVTKNLKKYSGISSNMIVKNFQKLHLFRDYSAILSDQHLYINGKELTEQEKRKTFGELKIQSNAVIILMIDPPAASQSDVSEMEVDSSEPSQPENGFRGTILQGGM